MSVRVTGVFTDASGVAHDFTFTSNVEAEVEMAFPSPVTVDATTSNLTIDIEVASWFKDASGALIDPTTRLGLTSLTLFAPWGACLSRGALLYGWEKIK